MRKLTLSIFVAAFSLLSSLAFAHEHGDHPDQHLVFPGGIHAHVYWEAGPVEGTEGKLRVEFKNAADHKPLDIKAIPSVMLWMPSMGHGSAPTVTQRVLKSNGDVNPGVYRVTNVYFVMGGDWDVRLILKNTDGTENMQSFSVKIDGGSGGHHH